MYFNVNGNAKKFSVNGLLQTIRQEDHNRFGFEKELIEKMNRSILDEL